MFTMEDLKNNLEGIEKKLRTSSSNSLNCEEERMVDYIMVFSDRIRKLRASDSGSSSTVVSSEKLSALSANSNFTFVCELCCADIIILNKDYDYSLQMHKQSAEHVDFLEGLELLKNPIPFPNISEQKGISNEIPDGEIRSILSNLESNLKDVTDWLVVQDKTQRCSFCNCKLPANNLETHSRGRRHTQQVKKRKEMKK